jgi:Rod binding domain-containing protein
MDILTAPDRATSVADAQLTRLRSAGATRPTDAREAKRVGREFEAMFVAQMLTPMFEALPTDGMFGGGHTEKIMRSFHIDALARSIVDQRGIGIADAVARELLRTQETPHA